MMVTVIHLLLLIGVCWGNFNSRVQGASCVKLNGQLFTLGGEIYNSRWEPLENIYKVNLNSIRNLDHNNNIQWSAQVAHDYKPPGTYCSAATAPLKDAIYYFGGRFNNVDTIAVRGFYTDDENVAESNPGPESLQNNIRSQGIQTDIVIKASLVINDLNLNELLLFGANFTGKDKQTTINDFVHIIETRTNKWRSYKSNFITGTNYLSAVYKGRLFVFGPETNLNILSNYSEINQGDQKNQLILGVQEIDTEDWKAYSSSGDIPSFNVKYTYTQEGHLLYLVGENHGKNGKIYILNLELFKWLSIEVPDFNGYESGCLTFHDDTLFHYFGVDNVKGTQLIDTSLWPLEARPDSKNLTYFKSSERTELYIIIIGSMCGLIAIVAVGAIFYFWRKRQSKIKPPEFLEGFVTCDPTQITYNDNIQLIESGGSTQGYNPKLYEISELCPDDCFEKKTYLSDPALKSTELKKSDKL